MDKLKLVEQTQVRDDLPRFTPGDTINVHYRVKEGDKERIQQYEGVVISIRGSGANRTFVVRKVSNAIGVERIFPFSSPYISKIEVKKRGRVRRAKLFYLRERKGKSARLREETGQRGAAAAAEQNVKAEEVAKQVEKAAEKPAENAPKKEQVEEAAVKPAGEEAANEKVAKEEAAKDDSTAKEQAAEKETVASEEAKAPGEPTKEENTEEKA